MVIVELIFTYEEKSQDLMRMEFDPNITEEKFMVQIFNELGTDAKDLVKISCCQLTQLDDEKILPFLMERWGKYYFNQDVNHDDDTKRWAKFRDDFLIFNQEDM